MEEEKKPLEREAKYKQHMKTTNCKLIADSWKLSSRSGDKESARLRETQIVMKFTMSISTEINIDAKP
jgi:hypothetical protein